VGTGTEQQEDPETAAAQGLVEIIRSRLETLGPVTATALAKPLDIDKGLVSRALLTLEIEGFAMRGLFRVNSISACETRFGDSEEWCERRLLARIGRYTIRTLRKEIEPVSPAAFMRFVLHWQGLSGERQRGPEALRDALYRLQGFAAPAVAWESSLLPHRISAYSQNQLDQLLTTGEFMWLRPFTPVKSTRRVGPVRNTPIMFFERSQIQNWLPWITHPDLTAGKLTDWASLSSQANCLRDVLLSNGASFFVDLMSMTGLLRSQLEEALAELVAWGIVTSDSFAGLRVLITPSSKRPGAGRGRRNRSRTVETAGRWSLVELTLSHQTTLPDGSQDSGPIAPVQDVAIEPEQIAVALLDRYGVVFRALLIREHRSLPHWRELTRVFRRLEARGEVRGGRFVNGFSGEQFAWPEAVERLREFRDPNNQTGTARPVIVSAADPLNLHGITTPGNRIAAVSGNRLLYKEGVSIAQLVAGEFHWQLTPDPPAEWSARQLLIRNDPTTAVVTNLPRTVSS
jgi:ATP-dependent Lhr-like helicase